MWDFFFYSLWGKNPIFLSNRLEVTTSQRHDTKFHAHAETIFAIDEKKGNFFGDRWPVTVGLERAETTKLKKIVSSK